VTVYSYVVAFDSGFSPNPFHGVCTLACCKPGIRRSAQVGDLVVGLSTRGERFVYAMRVDRVIDFTTYWSNRQYACKKPKFDAPFDIARCGDNIYRPSGIGEFRQLPSMHSHRNGSEDVGAKRKDLSGLHVLVSDTYAYFGREGPLVTPELSFLEIGRGHRCRFTEAQVAQVAAWFADLPSGVKGRPARWPASDDSWQRS
jgi:hypothetical protein